MQKKSVPVVVIFKERIYEVHRNNLSFKVFGPSDATFIACCYKSPEEALQRARRRLFVKEKIERYTVLSP